MKLSNEELKKYYFGAYRFEETEDGYLQAFQYTKAQEDYFEGYCDMYFERCTASTAKTLEFITDATELSFDYKVIWKGSADTFEVLVDGFVIDIRYIKAIMDTGRMTFELPEGKKNVTIYLPADATALIKNFEINASAQVPEKNEKVLWLGDSITQGYGPLRSSQTYVSVANRILNYDILNQGIGGYIYDKNSLMTMEGYKPDKIIVAMGTNQYHDDCMKDIGEYYDLLTDIYGSTIPILTITPIWRGDQLDDISILMKFCDDLKQLCGRYPNIHVVDGFKMVPHFHEYYLDGLHPNEFGCEVYGRNLAEKIKELNF